MASDSSDTACGLRGVGGRFITDDYDDEARVRMEVVPPDMAGSTDLSGLGASVFQWYADSDNGKRVWYACVK